MKAATSLLAVLLMLSSTSLAQTAPTQETEPTQQTAQPQQAVPAQETAPAQQAVPVQETAPAQQAVPTQQAVAGGDASKPEAARPEAEGQATAPALSPTVAAPAAEAADGSVGAVLAAPSAPVFAPGAKLFIAPMDGFEQTLAQSILKKKVPVVLVKETAKADFVMSGSAHVKKRGFISGWVLDTGGKGYVSITDARTGSVVFTHKFKRADSNLTEYWIYQGWADTCASDLKKTMKKK